VLQNIREAFPVSAELGLYGLVFAICLGTPAGMYAAARRNRAPDHAVMAAATIGLSVPAMVTGPMLLALFAIDLRWFGLGGWGSWRVKVLPALTLGLAYAGIFARFARAGTAEVLGSPFVLAARAKGLSELRVVLRHVLRPAIIPTVTLLGPATARILVGSVVVERVFAVPGISDYFVSGAMNRDYPMVMGVVVLYSALLVLFNLAVDVAHAVLDPRVRPGA
jgi:oligopeptide transport system permease protein